MKKIALLFIMASSCQAITAQLKLPSLVSDSMVLQRDQPLRIWGWARSGEKVTVAFNKVKAAAVTSPDGKWQLTLPAQKAGGPYTMDIMASDTIHLQNILVGDVWLCSGQSNMELPMERLKERYPGNIVNEPYNPFIRQFTVPTLFNFQSPQDNIPNAVWSGTNSKQLLQFSAVAYFFAKELYCKYHVPIGLIRSAVGGSPAEAWLSDAALRQFPVHLAIKEKFRNQAYLDSVKRTDQAASDNWYRQLYQQDLGNQESMKWFDTAYDASGWKQMQVPAYFDEQGVTKSTGVVWIRKEIDLQHYFPGSSARLRLGNVIDRDSVYINGKFAATTGYQYPPRIYTIPPGLLKRGKNSIVVKVINYSGRGGFYKDKPYYLVAGKDSIDLKGNWQYKVSATASPIPSSTTLHYLPGGLYNAIIAPLLPSGLKGVIWYQGEANTRRAEEYKTLFPALINDWRNSFRQPGMPFLFVQLANYMEAPAQPRESQWAELRDAQRQTLSVPNTGMAVTIDIGEWNDIHPLDKETVGKRLALAAGKIAYGKPQLLASGPVFSSAKTAGNRMVLSFTQTGSGLMMKGDRLQQFAIAGEDKKFIWANAVIAGNKVEVWNEAITQPRYVRYAWADNPAGANLYNKEGLPASPFQTDPRLTDGTLQNRPVISTTKGLKAYYNNYFPVGVAVSPQALKTDEAQLILHEFNSLTPENAMKMGPIHPKENEYYWKDADSIAAFASRNHLKLRGHTLCWHNQVPDWIFTDANGQQVNKEVLLRRLKEHITALVSRYKGQIYAWDVVNEVISDKKGEYFRNSPWYEICGEEFVARAFEYAHAADPDALLFYNDYNEIDSAKREKIYRMIKGLKDAGVPIHGIGMQGHWAVNEPSREQLAATLERFSSLGLKLQITELDISVYPKEHNARERKPEDSEDRFTATREQAQLEKYQLCFELFRKYRSQLSGVTFWNISDRHSWLDDFPVKDRKDYPLLFNSSLQPKKVYWSVVNF